MKIPLSFINGRLILTVKIQTKRVFGQFEFYIDTGSTSTFIGVADAIKLQVPVDKFPFKHTAQIGGSSIAIHEINGVTIYCRDDKDNLIKLLDNEVILVARGLRSGPEGRAKDQQFPSLLGTDFLLANKLVLYFDPSENTGYLEKRE